MPVVRIVLIQVVVTGRLGLLHFNAGSHVLFISSMTSACGDALEWPGCFGLVFRCLLTEEKTRLEVFGLWFPMFSACCVVS